MILKRESYVPVILGIIGILVVGMSWRFEEPQAKWLPMILGSVLTILSALQLLKDMLVQSKQREAKERVVQSASTLREQHLRFLVALAWILGFAVGIYLLGFVIAIPLFIVTYVKSRGRSWLKSILLALMVTAFVYGGFELGFKVYLHRGFILTW
jgi:ABC-type sugar transport system permease subunit